MDSATLQTVSLDIPKADMRLFKELAKKMGWLVRTPDKCSSGLDEAIEDYKAGHVHQAKDVDDLMKQLMA
ncbi:hypothetical protein AAE250_16630 [Bacteroides sp. GD17]|jgi:hypothetical protein|uniref:hypothetical protein n=1 Tax=Bacteroides sp. GD17 TaxID=3139826 RepID=UPI0025FFD726|nr:hypothetical protein [uncultured Bacteroides sp.]